MLPSFIQFYNSFSPNRLIYQEVTGGVEGQSQKPDAKEVQEGTPEQEVKRTEEKADKWFKGLMQSLNPMDVTPEALLALSKRSMDKKVIEFVAGNPKTPAEGLANMVKEIKTMYDPSKAEGIAIKVLDHPNLTTELKKEIADVFGHNISPKPSGELISKIIGVNKYIDRLASKRDNVLPETLTILADSTDRETRMNVAYNENTPEEALKKLQKEDSFISRIATEQLEKRGK